MRRRLEVCAAVLLVLGTASCAHHPRPPVARPNILLVSIDSLRADHVGALGYERPTTPTIDELAADGTLFTNALSSTSWTLPAHAALLTGLADAAHGVVMPSSRLDERAATLAEALAAAGYRTVGFFSGPFLDTSFGFAQGFERYVDCTTYGVARSGLPLRKLHERSHHDRTNPTVLWNVLHELATPDPRPFFFFVHMWDVHYDLIAPAEFVELFDPHYRKTYDGSDFRHDPRFRVGMDEALYRHVLALYDAEIRYTDATLATIVEALDAAKKLDQTLVVITADHGDEFLDHGGKGHRHTLFQELIRVPLVFRLPGVVAKARLASAVSLTDVAPTILELAGVAALKDATGRSLAAALRNGEEPEPAPVLAELVLGAGGRGLTALVDGNAKLVIDARRRQALLFDLARDPFERSGVPADRDPRAERLLTELHAVRGRARELGKRLAAHAPANLDESLSAELGALGYLE